MSDQEKREICKAFAYGVGIEEIAAISGMTVAEALRFRTENADTIEEIKTHYAEMEG